MASIAIMLLMLCFFIWQESVSCFHFSFTESGTDQSVSSSIQKEEYLQLFVAETKWHNDLVLGPLFPRNLRSVLPHFLQTWLRNYILGLVVYFCSGGLRCLYIYHRRSSLFFSEGNIPAWEPVMSQIYVTMQAMPFYTAFPSLSEYMVEKGWTHCYSRIGEVGWSAYLVHCFLYLALLEFGIYWTHRGLHEIKPLYKTVHATHHVYNKQDTLSPFGGLAFHPLDGILQVLPHVVSLFFVPMHFFSHEVLLFMEGVWTANVHDSIEGMIWPIMGATYHTIHHITYQHNYGHYTIFMDWACGTLGPPSSIAEKMD